GLGRAPAGAHLRWHPRAVDLAGDLRTDRAVDGAHRRVRLVAESGAGTVPAAARAGQPGDAARHYGDGLWARRDDRHHDLYAALLPGHAWTHRDAVRARAHPGHRPDHPGLDDVGTRDDVHAPLQDLVLCRHVAGDARRGGAGVVAGNAARLVGGRERPGWIRG